MKKIDNPDEFVKTILNSKIKLIDFGFSRILEENEKALTFIGNINSMSKEVLIGPYDFQSEIWAIGIVTYNLLTGGSPFYASSKNDIMDKLKTGDYSFSPKVKTSSEIIDFIQMLLQDDPKKRPPFREIFKHDFLTNDSKTFNDYKFQNNQPLVLSIYQKKQIYNNEINLESKLIPNKNTYLMINPSFNSNEDDDFLDENYFEKLYQLSLFEVDKTQELLIYESHFIK